MVRSEYLVTKEDAAKWGYDEFMIWGERWEENGEQTGRARYWGPDYNHNGKILSGDKSKFGPDLLHGFVVDFIRDRRDQPFFINKASPVNPATPPATEKPAKKKKQKQQTQ